MIKGVALGQHKLGSYNSRKKQTWGFLPLGDMAGYEGLQEIRLRTQWIAMSDKFPAYEGCHDLCLTGQREKVIFLVLNNNNGQICQSLTRWKHNGPRRCLCSLQGCAVQWCTMQYSVIQWVTVLCSTVKCIALHSITACHRQFSVVQCIAKHCSALQFSAV